jgi:hypothetical protein
MTTYTTRTGVQIGILSKKQPPIYHDADALRLQEALINKRKTCNAVDWLVISVCLAAAGIAWVVA